jgi:hypothetical protein
MRSRLRRLRKPIGITVALFALAAMGCHCSTAPRPRPEAPPPAPPAALTAPVPVAGAPYLAYTDLVAGPTSGGEGDKGVYLSLFGTNFGSGKPGAAVKVLIGGVEVDNYRYLGPSRGRRDLQQITVQVGALGHPAPGRPLPVAVVVNGVSSNTDHTFTVQPGDIRFVAVTGDDVTAVKNDITHPWRCVQRPAETGALSASQPGDVIVLRGGPGVVWSDVGYDNRWFRFRRTTGDAPTGSKGHGYISIIAYPGEDVHYVPPPNTSGGIHGIGEDYPQFSDWIVISGLHIESVADSRSDGAPVNLQAYSDHWRVVNNELGPWPSAPEKGNKAGGLTGNGKSIAILGNNIHDIGGGTENHGIYLDSGSDDVEIAYNLIHGIQGGNLIQTYDNLGGQPLERIAVHHNLIYTGERYGLNISEGTHSFRAWNNVIYDTAMAGVRFNVKSDPATNIVVAHNTIVDCNRVSTHTNGLIANDWDVKAGTVLFEQNIVVAGANSRATSYFHDSADAEGIKLYRNLWFGLGPAPREESAPVGGTLAADPRFVDQAGHDFRLAAGSPAIHEAPARAPLNVGDDYQLKARPTGTQADVGAYTF